MGTPNFIMEHPASRAKPATPSWVTSLRRSAITTRGLGDRDTAC